jgi:Uma2 family endonuclease
VLTNVKNEEMKIYTPEDAEEVFARTECRMELVDGQIIPKEASEPLDDEVLAYILSKEFDFHAFQNLYLMPQTSINHSEIIAQLNHIIASQINLHFHNYYINEMKIKVVSFASFRIPDITFSLRKGRIFDEKGLLENPISIVEILSPSTEKKNQNEKREEYQAIESLQEYVLIAQDSYKITQYIREGKTKWIAKIYDSKDQTCVLTVGIKISLKKLYEETDWAQNEEENEEGK